MTMQLKNNLILIEEGSKYFEFIENMLTCGKKNGRIKLKNGSKLNFRYVTCTNSDNKKIHYISI